MEFSSDYQSLEVVSVQSGLVSTIGDLQDLFPQLSQLDLSRNLLTSWSQIFDICSQLSNLYWLNVRSVNNDSQGVLLFQIVFFLVTIN